MPILKPELMSPAGHWPQLHAAIEAGADAVYFGLNHFSARAKVGFDLDELPSVFRTLHARGVKGFVTFNTLVFDHELKLAQETLEAIAAAGADAVIVQDIGVAQFVQRTLPDLPVHGSTQMSITSAEGCALAKQWGCQRVVLGRELSIRDIRQIAAATDVELEVFVHGALCVSYSGQCFSSEAWGGRSANRGQCAQACRLPYELMVDGKKCELGEYRYLLSPGDLFALDWIPQLCELGIACFKIEGRYKEADYVGFTTRAYRQAIDAACEQRPLTLDSQDRQDLEQIYSRGLGPYFISGINHQQVVHGRAPRHRGVRAGTVTQVFDHFVRISPQIELKRGDGVVFDAAHRRSPQERESGGFLFDVIQRGPSEVDLYFDIDKIDLRRVEPGDWLWRTHDPQLAKKIRPVIDATDPVYTRPLDFEVSAQVGQPLTIRARCDEGKNQASWSSSDPVAAAQNRPTTLEQIEQQLARLGGTAFHLGSFQCEVSGQVFVPTSLLNQARRELVAELVAQRVTVKRPRNGQSATPSTSPNEAKPSCLTPKAKNTTANCQLHVLVRKPEQLAAAIETRPASITLDYLELYGLKNSVDRIRQAEIEVRVASPRILKPAEEKIVRFLVSLECPILVRSTGLLHSLAELKRRQQFCHDLVGDFSLNAANQLTAQAFLELGLTRLTPGYDLNAEQVADMAQLVGPQYLECVIHQHLPVFHTEHCVFCRFLSQGTDSSNCGHPCETHRIGLRDDQGRVHPVLADVGCRNTVFSAEIQSAAKHLGRWRAVGVQDFRVEFVHQSADDVHRVVSATQNFFRQQCSAEELERAWQAAAPHRTTEGSFFVPPDFRNLVQLGGGQKGNR